MSARMKVTINEGVGEEKSLCLIAGFKPLHVSFASPCRPMRILSPVIEVTALTVLHVRKQLPLSNTVTSEFIRHDYSRFVFQADEQTSEETLRRLTITATLNQNVEHYTVLVHGTPEIMKYAVDPDEDLVQMPFVPWSWPASQDPLREARAKFRAPAANGLVRQSDPTLSQQQFNVAETQTERMIQPDSMADDLSRKPVAVVRVGLRLHPGRLTARLVRDNTG